MKYLVDIKDTSYATIEVDANSIEEAELYKNWFIEINKEDAPLPEGYTRLEDLKGCKVLDSKTEKQIGVVINVVCYSTTPNLLIETPNKKTFYVPFIDKFVTYKNVEEKILKIEVVEGMI